MTALSQAKRIVIKLGTGVLTSGIGQLDTDRISILCEQVAKLREYGIDVILVSSGSIGLGMGKLGLEKRPKDLASLQACAAIGQTILINTWQKGFDPHELTVAQILLTREDLRSKNRHNAVFSTIECLLAKGTVPIVNENDTVSAEEIKFGDNDTLSALVASVTNADLLFILSNIPGLIDMAGTGEVVPTVEAVTPEIEAMAQGTNTQTSVGGMISKLSAAKIAQRAGCGVIIGSGKDPTFFDTLLKGQPAGTYFLPRDLPVKSYKRWIAIQDRFHGSVMIDQGAYEALQKGGSLLAAGVVSHQGNFGHEDMIEIISPDGAVFAQGMTSCSHEEIDEAANADKQNAIVVHRSHLVML